MDEKGQQSEGVPPIPVISYEPAVRPIGPRPKWVYGVVGAYLLLLGALWAFPVVWAANDSSSDDLRVVSGFTALMTICGLAMILIPVRIVRRRPITRRSIWIPILASGVLAGALMIGGTMAAAAIEGDHAGDPTIWAVLIAGGAVWLGWTAIFAIIAIRRGPGGIGLKLHRWLIAGSVLELLVAVPAHVIVRRRNECCADIVTGIGICIGVGVAVISFGPSVLLLYHLRRKQIRIEG